MPLSVILFSLIKGAPGLLANASAQTSIGNIWCRSVQVFQSCKVANSLQVGVVSVSRVEIQGHQLWQVAQ